MLGSYDDLCSNIYTVLRGSYCVIQHLCCNTNKTIIIILVPAYPGSLGTKTVKWLLLLLLLFTV